MVRDWVANTLKKEGQQVSLSGFINTRRDHGKIIFFDLRDASGFVQVVATPKEKKAYEVASGLGSEDVVKVVGTIGKRPAENVNPEIPTGKIEVLAQEIQLVSKATALPIPIEGTGYDIEEAIRFKNRHIDLRRDRLQKNLRLRHQVTKLVREFLDKEDFVEIETPYLSKTTPEGARDFLVPSRLQKGKFYALAQSPQQYKQLLMIAGFERYYQLARAFRDEDLRADRQFEHTQIDIEMAFVEREDVMRLMEEMIIFVAAGCNREIAKKPFPILAYKEAKDKYDTDRPNLAKDKNKLHFLWLKDFPLFERTDTGDYTFAHNPFAAPRPDHVEDLMKKKNLDSLQSLQYDLVCNGEEVGGGSIRIHEPEVQKQVFRILGYEDAQIDKQFGHIIKAYNFGAPVHGGIALGLDRLVALLAGEDNIREVIAFPVTSGGQTSIMDAPSPADPEQLKELGIKIADQIQIKLISMVRTRIAPSPTGDPHIGTAYAALFNYAFAKKNKGKFILRIEDTDRTRLVKDAEGKITAALKWLGLIWDEGPYHQSDRLELYKKAAEELVGKKAAYYCNCSPQRLEKLRADQQKRGEVPHYDQKCLKNPPKVGPFVVRLKVPKEGETGFRDEIKGKITFQNKDIDDAVLLKSDGWPTYHLAVVVDDSDMQITHVIRAEEWLSSTPKHVLLYKALDKKFPVVAHLPLLRNPDRSKISKRKNPVSLVWYKDQGYLPEALLNYLAMMGWSMPDSREKFNLREFIDNLDLSRIDPAGPVFDLQKLEWLNGEWIRSLSNSDLAERLKNYTKASNQDLEKVLPLVKERLKKLSEFEALTDYFFTEEIPLKKEEIVQEGKSGAETINVLKDVGNALKTKDWSKATIEKTIKERQQKFGWSNTDLFQTIRAATTGRAATPPLFDTLEALGKSRTVSRVEKAINLLSH